MQMKRQLQFTFTLPDAIAFASNSIPIASIHPSIKRCPLIARQCHFPIKTEQLSRDRHDTRRYMPIQSLLDSALTPSVPFSVPSRLYSWILTTGSTRSETPQLPPNAGSPLMDWLRD
ncbi:hypothetical protein E2542_SST02462 [Spatholobus suberectus]|nr:hypothetical protein E2542_SST02462 [Spatholobus suberectus]